MKCHEISNKSRQLPTLKLSNIANLNTTVIYASPGKSESKTAHGTSRWRSQMFQTSTYKSNLPRGSLPVCTCDCSIKTCQTSSSNHIIRVNSTYRGKPSTLNQKETCMTWKKLNRHCKHCLLGTKLNDKLVSCLFNKKHNLQ